MPLRKRTLSIPFAQGVDTKTDPKVIQPPYLLVLENGIFTRTSSIKKRNGYEALADLPTPTATLIGHDGELVAFSDNTLYSYVEKENVWREKDTYQAVKITQQQVSSGVTTQINPRVGTCQGIAGAMWVGAFPAGAQFAATVYEIETGNVLLQDQELAAAGTALGMGAVGVSDTLMFFYIRAGTLYFRSFDCTGLTLGAETAVNIPGLGTVASCDVISYTATEAIVAACDATNNVIRVARVNAAGNTIAQAQVAVPSGNIESVMVIVDAATNYIGVVWSDSPFSAVSFAQFTTAPALTVGPINIAAAAQIRTFGILRPDAGTGTKLFASDSSVVAGPLREWFITNAGAVSGGVTIAGFNDLSGRPFKRDGNEFLHVQTGSTETPTSAIITVDGEVTGYLPRLSAYINTANGPYSDFVEYETGKYFYSFFANARDEDRRVVVTNYDFLNNQLYTNDNLERELYLGGGVVKHYDGAQLTELGFLVPTEFSAAPLGQTTGGSLTTGGAYQYTFLYRWTDVTGRIHRSAPAIPESITLTGANNAVNVRMRPLTISDKEFVVIEVYRTLAGVEGIFQFAGQIDNDPTATQIVFLDTISDADLADNPFLYTNDGSLLHDPPPRGTALTAGKGRLFVVSDEDDAVWYSIRRPATTNEGLAFNLGQRIVPGKDKPTALGNLDDKIVVFEPTRTSVFSGDGPNELGTDGQFTQINLNTSDVGCENQHSVVRSNNGLMFSSQKGIYLLARDLSTPYIGFAVETYNNDFVQSATLLPNVEEIRFLLDNDIVLTYAYDVNAWSVFTNHDAVRAALYRGVFTYARSNGNVRRESPTLFTDVGTQYSLSFTTAWFKLRGLQGFQRVRWLELLGELISDTTLAIEVRYDYRDVTEQTTVVPATTALYPPNGPMQFRIRMDRQKCEAIQYRISEQTHTGNNDSYNLTAMDLEVAVKTGLNRLDGADTFS